MEADTNTSPAPDALEVLVRTMSPAQRLRFKQAVVRQAIHLVSLRLPPEAEDDGHRGGIFAAARWLEEPTDEKACDATAFGVSECWDGGVRYHDYPLSFLDPAWAAGDSDVCRAAQYALKSLTPEERTAARRWQLAAAEAILRGDEPLPPE